MIGKEIKSLVFAVGFAVPLQQNGQWTLLSFNKIPANAVEFSEKALKVKVAASASPLIYRFPESRIVSEFAWKLKIENFKESPSDQFPEDFPFRFGLVATGTNRMSRVQRLFAADWVKKLFEWSPPEKGLDKIYFYNLTSQARW
jgi:hypothetical protein